MQKNKICTIPTRHMLNYRLHLNTRSWIPQHFSHIQRLKEAQILEQNQMDLRRSSGSDPCIWLGEKDHSHLTDEETRPRAIKWLVQTHLRSSKGGMIARAWPHTSLNLRARHVTGSSVPFPLASQFQVRRLEHKECRQLLHFSTGRNTTCSSGS